MLLVGAGGLCSNEAKILVQVGVGAMAAVDEDLVEDSNRNRQLFTAKDVGKPKAHRLLPNLVPYATYKTVLHGYYMRFEDWIHLRRRPHYDIICCGVDSIPTMVAVARYGLAQNTPVVFVNVSADGEACRIFIQRCGKKDPCLGCYWPQALTHEIDRDQPCVPVPAIADILQVAVGFAARALIGEILGVPIGDYHSRDITFSGIDIKKSVAKCPECPLCRTFAAKPAPVLESWSGINHSK